MNPDKRPDEELNRVIAEWCGAKEGHWKCTGCGEEVPGTHVTFDEHHGIDRCMAPVVWIDKPNYCRDLNACHEAEGKIYIFPKIETIKENIIRKQHTHALEEICKRDGWGTAYQTHRATARQRAEALVRVIEQQKGECRD